MVLPLIDISFDIVAFDVFMSMSVGMLVLVLMIVVVVHKFGTSSSSLLLHKFL